jgi:hypothetical protein
MRRAASRSVSQTVPGGRRLDMSPQEDHSDVTSATSVQKTTTHTRDRKGAPNRHAEKPAKSSSYLQVAKRRDRPPIVHIKHLHGRQPMGAAEITSPAHSFQQQHDGSSRCARHPRDDKRELAHLPNAHADLLSASTRTTTPTATSPSHDSAPGPNRVQNAHSSHGGKRRRRRASNWPCWPRSG